MPNLRVLFAFFSQPCLALALLFSLSVGAAPAGSPVALYGHLATKQGYLVSETNVPLSLAGPSLFWSNSGWPGEAFYNAGVVETVAKDWNASVIRAAMGADSGGSYIKDPEANKARVIAVVEAAIEQGIYVIIDWHSHRAEDIEAQAVAFFSEMATRFGDSPNVIYEIYNEPLNTTDWQDDVKPYANKVISAIRKIDPDNVILVGTPTWSQDVDLAAKDPLIGYANIAYVLHFYAGTHKQPLRDKAQKAIDAGLTLFVSEWGSVEATGDGDIDLEESLRWLVWIKQNHLSHVSWSITNKQEGSAMLLPHAPTNGKWKDEHLSPNGLFLREIFRAWQVTP
ncbi:glycoside hydrolase family 5 protein [Alteromonas oceanisediminis]|uniref:glycoside hydrolase family 5 protein n=1 Tax=Alteromonas oceanisediminis TaxID=2836180 RepID=UPI001BDA623A|nr:glycoside hydrolase family 5 protein [Alteromonas oceanisediminis]MBT0587822.1 cellulase family glycosylhydrolase [Alteromonas oceanisediminis]